MLVRINYKSGQRLETQARLVSVYPQKDASVALLVLHFEYTVPSKYIELDDVECMTLSD